MRTYLLLTAVCLSSISVYAQTASNPLSTGAKQIFAMVKANVLKSAEAMPESDYAFRPTPDVRTFGQLIGHIADGQYEFCGGLHSGAEDPEVEKTKKTKAELIDALKTAFAYCDASYNSLTDATASDMVKLFGRDMAKLTILTFNTAHTDEHYGNLVTYMRVKGMVPPSSKK